MKTNAHMNTYIHAGQGSKPYQEVARCSRANVDKLFAIVICASLEQLTQQVLEQQSE